MHIVYVKFAQLHTLITQHAITINCLKKCLNFALFARFFDDQTFFKQKIAVSIYSSILIMLLLEISGDHVSMLSRSVLVFFFFSFVGLFVFVFVLFCFVFFSPD